METIRKINDDLSIAGQIALEQLPQLVEEGVHAIVDLRSPHEKGFSLDEQQKAEFLGLIYINIPFAIDSSSIEAATRILQLMQQLPRPMLVHCDNAMRAAAIALMYIAIRQGVALEKAFDQAKQLGLFEIPV
ncbi:hypothetical protein BST81_24800 [Leptolyngbya sp. 'hensonii']|uniref:fused DSP-PTPase phosphatase/NAD kinase-like protein n=1 Tax=Leptolyngbya sp. 'hensonii' TaxID=1922337 RepID=UPI00094F7991|nr:sulfur transferase domain-containing protein [Leptolyngbya sp. 'hensonii']OLP15742.1 hypothetical protein BST81_24800 [Leptolyngbya sp. 'hensonii']